MHVLPKICTSSEIYGHLSDTVLAGIPISGVSKSAFHFGLLAYSKRNYEIFDSF